MKKIKIVLVVLILLYLSCGLIGCDTIRKDENLKDAVLQIYNDILQSFSKAALTSDFCLQGERSFNEDEYTGVYTAEYNNFVGKEYIFGGTALQRENGDKLKISYSVKAVEGSFTLYWIDGTETHTIADTDVTGTYEITVDSGDNYIVLDGDGFTGNLELEVK